PDFTRSESDLLREPPLEQVRVNLLAKEIDSLRVGFAGARLVGLAPEHARQRIAALRPARAGGCQKGKQCQPFGLLQNGANVPAVAVKETSAAEQMKPEHAGEAPRRAIT